MREKQREQETDKKAERETVSVCERNRERGVWERQTYRQRKSVFERERGRERNKENDRDSVRESVHV